MKASHPRPRPLWPYFLVGFAALALVAMGSAARAATDCGDLAATLEYLRTNYAEDVLWQGVGRDGRPVIITANPDGSTWSPLTRPETAIACIVVDGASWTAGQPASAPAGEEG